jgi:hypothetical protein
MFGKADFRNAEFNGPEAHCLESIVPIFRKTGVQVIVLWDHEMPDKTNPSTKRRVGN